MILNLYGKENKLKLPDIILDENKNYEIGITNICGIPFPAQNSPRLIEVLFNGIKAMPGPKPYTLTMVLAGNWGFRMSSGNKIPYFPLRTNLLGATCFQLKVAKGALEFSEIFIQLEIRESNG